MTARKQLLHNLLDIGGVATLNNLYSPVAKSYAGSLLHTRKLFKAYLTDGLLECIVPIGKPGNKSREVFYCLTKNGARYIGRTEEYTYKRIQRSPFNVPHESAKFDIALALLRLYPHLKFSFRYDINLYGVRPDIFIRIDPLDHMSPPRFILLEIERKKSVERTFKEKVMRYEEMFKTIEQKKSHNVNHYKVLFVYTDIYFDVLLRPQQYHDTYVIQHIERVNHLLKNLVLHYCKHLPDARYRFMPFHHFHMLHNSVWFTPLGRRVTLEL